MRVFVGFVLSGFRDLGLSCLFWSRWGLGRTTSRGVGLARARGSSFGVWAVWAFST